MHGQAVHHDAADPLFAGELGKRDDVLVVGRAEVGVLVQRVQRGQRARLLRGRSVEHDGGEVDEDALERSDHVGLRGDLQPQRRGTGLELGQGELTVAGVHDAHVPVPLPRRADRRVEPVEQVRRAERRHLDSVQRAPRELAPDEVVGVVVSQASGLAQDGGGRRLPLAARVLVLGSLQPQVLHRVRLRRGLHGLVRAGCVGGVAHVRRLLRAAAHSHGWTYGIPLSSAR